MSILENEFNPENHFQYQERYRYYVLLKDYENDKLFRWEFASQFKDIYDETYKIMDSMRRDSEEFKSLNFTSKSEGFASLIDQILWEIDEPVDLEESLKHLNLDKREIAKRNNNLFRKSLKRLSEKMEAYLES